jgi:hypothetical protein
VYIRNSSKTLAYLTDKWVVFTSDMVFAAVAFWASYMWQMDREKLIDAATLVKCLREMLTRGGRIVHESLDMYNDICKDMRVKSVLKCIREPDYYTPSWETSETVKFMQGFPMIDVMNSYIPDLAKRMIYYRESVMNEYKEGYAKGMEADAKAARAKAEEEAHAAKMADAMAVKMAATEKANAAAAAKAAAAAAEAAEVAKNRAFAEEAQLNASNTFEGRALATVWQRAEEELARAKEASVLAKNKYAIFLNAAVAAAVAARTAGGGAAGGAGKSE